MINTYQKKNSKSFHFVYFLNFIQLWYNRYQYTNINRDVHHDFSNFKTYISSTLLTLLRLVLIWLKSGIFSKSVSIDKQIITELMQYAVIDIYIISIKPERAERDRDYSILSYVFLPSQEGGRQHFSLWLKHFEFLCRPESNLEISHTFSPPPPTPNIH